MTPKQKAIKQAYIDCFVQSGMTQQEAEEKWNEVQSKVDENGWVIIRRYDENPFDHEGVVERKLVEVEIDDVYFWRLKSLSGIETNRGWKRVEDGLPEEKGDYFGCYPDGSVSCFFFNPEDDFDVTVFSEELTHWQPITKPDLPIF